MDFVFPILNADYLPSVIFFSWRAPLRKISFFLEIRTLLASVSGSSKKNSRTGARTIWWFSAWFYLRLWVGVAVHQSRFLYHEWLKAVLQIVNSDKDWNLLLVILSIKELDLLANTIFFMHVGVFYTPCSWWKKTPFWYRSAKALHRSSGHPWSSDLCSFGQMLLKW